MSGAAPPPQPPSDPNQPPGYSGGVGPNDPIGYTGPSSGAGATGPGGTPAPAGPDPSYQPDPSQTGAYPNPQGYPDPNIPQGPPGPVYGGDPASAGASTQPSSPASRSTSMSGTQAKSAMQNAHKFDLGIIACGLLAFVFSMFPFYSAEVKTSGGPTGFDLGDYGGGSWSAWHGFFGWFAALLALAVAILLALKLFGVLPLPGSTVRLAALAGFGVATVSLLLAFFVNPLPGEETSETIAGVTVEYSKGLGIGYWLCLIVVLAGLALSFMRKDAKD